MSCDNFFYASNGNSSAKSEFTREEGRGLSHFLKNYKAINQNLYHLIVDIFERGDIFSFFLDANSFSTS